MKIELEHGQDVSDSHVAQIAEALSLERFGHGNNHLLPLMRDALARNIQVGAGVYLQMTNMTVYGYDPSLLILSLRRRFNDHSSIRRLTDAIWDLGGDAVSRHDHDTPIATYPHEKGALVVYPQNR